MTRSDLPLGTVTFLFTDIEGSTRLLQELGNGYRFVLERHNDIVTAAVSGHEGVIVKNEGDGYSAAFSSAVEAVACAVDIQRDLAAETWPMPRPLAVRMGIHTGEGRLGGSDYVGMDVHRAARIGACGHGGQVLLSEATTRLTELSLPAGTRLVDLGTHRLKDLAHDEHLFQLSIDGLPSQFPPIRTISAGKGNLPRRVLAFVGRSEERAQVAEALHRSRLVTITGPGGVGKTSLALHVAEDLAAEFPDGAWLVEVSRVADETMLAAAVARQLRITEAAGQSFVDTLTSRLAGARMLLVLDGCEHLIGAVAKFVEQLLTWTSELQILTTSREWLSIRGEHLVQLAPLAIPPAVARSRGAIAEYDAVALFVDRARLVQPGFELDEANAGAVAEICRRLDGIPLAIELAAARLKVLPVGMLVERLDQQFALLSSRARDLPEHQQTLETTLDWSYDFLTKAEQTLFTRLSIFSGGFTLEAAEQVCCGGPVTREDVLDLLGRLVETSLVMATESEAVRCRLLEPIARYAAMRLDPAEHELLAERHADFFLRFAEAGAPQLLERDQSAWIAKVDWERYNLRNALIWADRTGNDDVLLRLVAALRWFWVIKRDVTEASAWIEKALGRRQGVADEVVAGVLNAAGLFALMRLDFDLGKAAFTEALELYRSIGDARGEARQLYHMTNLSWLADDIDEADRLSPIAEERSRQSGDSWGLAWTLAVRGTMARLSGDLTAAEAALTESHRVFSGDGGNLDLGWSYLRLGALARDQGDYEAAARHYAAGRDLLIGAGDSLGMAHANAGLGAIAWLSGDRDGAVNLYRSVLEGFSLSEEASNNLFELKTMIQGNPTTAELQQIVQWNRDRARQVTGSIGAKAAMAEYLYHMGKTAQRDGNLERARRALIESMRLAIDAEDGRAIAIAAAGVGVIIHGLGEDDRAARVLAFADRMVADDPAIPWPPPEEGNYAEVCEEVERRLGDGYAEAAAAGAALSRTEALRLVD